MLVNGRCSTCSGTCSGFPPPCLPSYPSPLYWSFVLLIFVPSSSCWILPLFLLSVYPFGHRFCSFLTLLPLLAHPQRSLLLISMAFRGSRGVQFVTSRVGLGQEVFKISRVGSDPEVFKSRGSSRVRSRCFFQILRVESGRVKR